MIKIFILTIVAIQFIAPAFSACPQNVQKIETGTSANCDGWLVSEPQMQKFAKTDDELELHKKLATMQDYLRKLDVVEIEYYKKQSETNAKALSKSESQKFWLGVGAFALGVVVTGIAAKAAIEATK